MVDPDPAAERHALAKPPRDSPAHPQTRFGVGDVRMVQVDVTHLKIVKSEMLELQPKPDWVTALREVGALLLVAYKILCDGKPWHAPGSGLETGILIALVANAALAFAKALRARKPRNSTLFALAQLEDAIEQVEPDDDKPVPDRWKFLSRKKA